MQARARARDDGTILPATARPSGARWPSSGGSACPSPRSRAAPGSASSSSAWCSRRWGARPTRAVSSDRRPGRPRPSRSAAREPRRRSGSRPSRRARRALTVALQEESLDWDPASTTTTAVRAGGTGWTLTGLKRFVPWAHVADAVLVPARGPEGLSLFIVDPRAKGVTLKPLTGMDLGTRWSELSLDGVAVGPDAAVGAPGHRRAAARGAASAGARSARQPRCWGRRAAAST